MLLDAKKQFRMELKRNQGIGWYRSLQICKHLEMHIRGKGPEITEPMRDKITKIAQLVKAGK
jgi:ribosomal protein S13